MALGEKECEDYMFKDTPKLAQPLRRARESCATKNPAETITHVKCETKHEFKIFRKAPQ